MRQLLLGGAALGLIASFGDASAADKPVKAPPVAAVDYWTGLYIGAHAGYGWGTKDWFNSPGFGGHFDGDGFLAGGQIGVNQHIGGGWVLGIEADASWSDVKMNKTALLGPGSGGTTTSTSAFESKIDWMASAAFRAGIAADRLYVYGKFGAAAVNEHHSISDVTAVLGVPTNSLFASASETRVGPLVGLGAEYAWGGNWSAKIEYNYIPFADKPVRLAGTVTDAGGTTPFAVERTIGQTLHLAKAGVNYRFGPVPPPALPAPVRAAGYDWSGLYLGGQGGYGWGRKKWLSFDPDRVYDVDGWLAGGQIGFNAQSGRVVIGVEAEGLWTDFDGGESFNIFTTAFTLATQVHWIGMVTGRLGYTPWDRWLVYLKAGAAFAEERHDDSFVAPGFSVTTTPLPQSQFRNGWVAGGGIEYAIAGNWSARAEYNFIDFGQRTDEMLAVQTVAGVNQNVGRTHEIRQTLQLVKFGLNYRFGAEPAPIAVRY